MICNEWIWNCYIKINTRGEIHKKSAARPLPNCRRVSKMFMNLHRVGHWQSSGCSSQCFLCICKILCMWRTFWCTYIVSIYIRFCNCSWQDWEHRRELAVEHQVQGLDGVLIGVAASHTQQDPAGEEMDPLPIATEQSENVPAWYGPGNLPWLEGGYSILVGCVFFRQSSSWKCWHERCSD